MVQAGQIIMNSFCGDFDIIEKKDGSLCTSVDIAVESFLQKELNQIHPGASFIAEESYQAENDFFKMNDWVWIIDPLDGTKNFIHNIPHFCVMVTLAYKNKPLVAAIYLPVTNDFYYAEHNKGLWLNKSNQILHQDRMMHKKSALIVAPYSVFQKISYGVVANNHNITIARRYFGCAGIDAIYLATGLIDFVMFENIAWWDIAAGMLCIAQAQGLRYTYKQHNKKSLVGEFTAGNQLLFSMFQNNNEQNL